MNLTKMLADWCADDSLVFGETARQLAQAAIFDTVGCMRAGAGNPAVVAAALLAPDEVSGKATSVAHTNRIPAAWAALINGCAADALDYDDNFFPAITHANAVLVPALFALAEECDAGPAKIIDAYIVGLEVQSQVGKLVHPSHDGSGWHAISTIGPLGAAAACGRLLRLDAGKLLHALSIGSSFAGGSKKQFGTMVKPLHAGMAAMHGIMAAKMAAAGMQGCDDVLQGRWSFEELFGGDADQPMVMPELFPKAPLAIEQYGGRWQSNWLAQIKQKGYPNGYLDSDLRPPGQRAGAQAERIHYAAAVGALQGLP